MKTPSCFAGARRLSCILALLAASSALLSACEPPEEKACPNGVSGLKAVVPPIAPSTPLEKELDVIGTLERPPGVTVYELLVAGVAATGTGINFNAFTAKVPYDRLASLASSGTVADPPTAEILITARINCDFALTTLAKFSVPVNLKPGVKVSRLVFETPLIPNGADYLPADQSASALMRLRANPEAAGAQVSLSTSKGSFDGVGMGNVVTLSGDGKTDAVASFAFKTDKDAQLSATAGGVSAATSITVAGAPTLVPSSATLGPGQAVRVTVFTDGKLKACQATPTFGLFVSSGGVNLMGASGGKDVTNDGKVDIDVSVPVSDGGTPSDAGAPSTVVSCVDVFGQFSTATYQASP